MAVFVRVSTVTAQGYGGIGAVGSYKHRHGVYVHPGHMFCALVFERFPSARLAVQIQLGCGICEAVAAWAE